MATEAQLLSISFAPPDPVLTVGVLTESRADGNSGAPWTNAISDPGLDVAKKTVCIKVRVSTMGNTRKVSTTQIEADADKDLLRVSKFRCVSDGVSTWGRKWFVLYADGQ